MNPGKDLKVQYGSSARISAIGLENKPPIRFIRNYENSAWGDVHLMTPNNTFKYCIFDGGTNNVQVHDHYNKFEYCTFRNATNSGVYVGGRNYGTSRSSFSLKNCLITNNNYGVMANYTYGDIQNCTIEYNTRDGLNITTATIGRNAYSYPGLFTNNLIKNNGAGSEGEDGIELTNSSSSIYFGYGSTPGNIECAIMVILPMMAYRFI
jgi:hypothetical protein